MTRGRTQDSFTADHRLLTTGKTQFSGSFCSGPIHIALFLADSLRVRCTARVGMAQHRSGGKQGIFRVLDNVGYKEQ